MNTESQSEKIWQYAMGRDSNDRDAKNRSLQEVVDQSGDDTTADFSDVFGSIPSKFSFHGLAQTQTQSEGVWQAQEHSGEGTESQKENLRLLIPSGSRSPFLSAAVTSIPRPDNPLRGAGGSRSGRASSSSHVTTHVTGASPRVAIPIIDEMNTSATAPSDPAPLLVKKGPVPHDTPLKLKHKSKAYSFHSSPHPPSPPALPRLNTMPPPRNRYAPRDIDPSSQDSFAGPPVPQGLNAFVRTQSVFNNTYIRGSKDGRPGVVFERSSHVSTASTSDPPPHDEVMSDSPSEQQDGDGDDPSATQLLLAAFEPRFSSPRAPSPVILARDSQSQHSQDSEDGGKPSSSGDEDGGGGGALLSHANSHAHSPLLSSSSSSYQLPMEPPVEPPMEATQPNTQSTQPNTQPTQTDAPLDLAVSPSVGASSVGPSPLPVPPHRRKELAALQAARLRAKEEVIPETPMSTNAPSVQVSVAPSISIAAVIETPLQQSDIPIIHPPRSRRALSAEIEGNPTAPKNHETRGNKPSAEAKGKAKQVDTVEPTHSRATRSGVAQRDYSLHRPGNMPSVPPSKTRGSRQPPEVEVVPDSQEEQQVPLEPEPEPATAPQRRSRQSEIVPDSQEGQQVDALTQASSPAIPLITLASRHDTGERPPTPTPAAVKSSLRKGELPQGVTHTRGGIRMDSVKGKRKTTAPPAVETSDVDEPSPSIQGSEAMDVDEGHKQPALRQSRPQVHTRKATATRPSKPKKVLPKNQKKPMKGVHAQTTTNTPVSRPSTRSRKRKSDDTQTESPRDSEAPLSISAPRKKRQRSNLADTPALGPAGPVLRSTRVLARRTGGDNYYLPGTVTVETVSADPIPPSTLFTVQFDDGHEEDVDVEFMRQFELELQDVVHLTRPVKGKLKPKLYPAQVLDVQQWDTREIVEVHELDGGPDADDYDVAGTLLRVSEDRILEQWNERRVSTRTLLRDRDFNEPAPNECLAGIGFIITLPDLPRSKRSLIKLIEASSGLVYEDWSAIVSLGGSVEVAGKRVTGKDPEMRIGKETRKAVPKMMFCVTDEPRTTPKYLIALALGVPCLSIEWILERVIQDNHGNLVDWPAYVLPAGHNTVTRMAASQSFDRAWWREGDNLPKLLSHPPIFKPFTGRAFLCVGSPEFLFSKKEFGTFPKVLLAMGASYVQAVTDISRVNLKGSQSFDYIVVDDGEALIDYKEAVAVNVSWLKKCLVTGIEGPIPWPDYEVI